MFKWAISSVVALVAVAAVAVGASAAPAKHAVKIVSFTASYSGTATTKQTDNTVDIAANGNGSGTLGSGKVTGTGVGDSSQQPCVPFTGTGSMTGAKGVVTFKVTPGSSGCGDEKGEVFAIVGHAVVTKTTGTLLAKAKGTLKFTGTYNRTDGNFNVKFSGKLTKK